jgi:hypothetical protein
VNATPKKASSSLVFSIAQASVFNECSLFVTGGGRLLCWVNAEPSPVVPERAALIFPIIFLEQQNSAPLVLA